MKKNVNLNYKQKLKLSINKANVVLICSLQIIFILAFVGIWFIQRNRQQLLIHKFENIFSFISIISLCFILLTLIFKFGFVPSIINKIKERKQQKYIKSIDQSELSEQKKQILINNQKQESYWGFSFWFILLEVLLFLLVAIILRMFS